MARTSTDVLARCAAGTVSRAVASRGLEARCSLFRLLRKRAEARLELFECIIDEVELATSANFESKHVDA